MLSYLFSDKTLLFPNNNNNNNRPVSYVFPLFLICICCRVGISQDEEARSNAKIGVHFSLHKNSSLIKKHHKKVHHELVDILYHPTAKNVDTGSVTSQSDTVSRLNNTLLSSQNVTNKFSANGTDNLLKGEKVEEIGIKNNSCADGLGFNSRGSLETDPTKKHDKQNIEQRVPISENQNDCNYDLQKDDVHIKIIDTDARFRRDPKPFQRWWPRRNRGRYWRPSRRGRRWRQRNRRRKWRQKPNMTTPLPTSTVLVDRNTGNRRVIITQPERRKNPNQTQTGGSTSISRREGFAYWNVPPFVLKMKRKLQQKIQQMSNMLYNGLSETLYNITRRSRYIANKYKSLKEDAKQLILDTHDAIEDIVKLSNQIFDTVLTISAFHRRLIERVHQLGYVPTSGTVPNITDFVNRDYSKLNRESFLLLRTMKHMRNKFFQLNYTYARHMDYYYDKLERIDDLVSGQRIRIVDLMDMAMYVSNQMSNMTKLKVPRVLRDIYNEKHQLVTENYHTRHKLYVTEQIHQDVTTFQKSCHLRLKELAEFNYTLLLSLPRPTIEPLTFKEKRKLQLLVNRVEVHSENIVKTALEIDNLLPPLIKSGKELILQLSMEPQSDSYKVWVSEKMLKRWRKISHSMPEKSGKRKWMRMRRRRIRRMRERMPKFKHRASERSRREADTQGDVDKLYDEIIDILTKIIKELDDMWMELFGESSGNIDKCEQIGSESSGEGDTDVECEVQGSGKMDITESESGTTFGRSSAGKNDNDDSNDFEFTDVKTVVVSSHRERLESIIRASLAQSKMYQKTSRNLLQDVQDIKSSLHDVSNKKVELETDVNSTAEVVIQYNELVTNTMEMRQLLKTTEEKINSTQEKCLAAQKLADLVLADKDELERLLEIKIKEKEKEEKEKVENGKNVRKKKKRLRDKSNMTDFDRKRDKGEKSSKEDRNVETDILKKELEENEKTKAELKALIEKYLQLQKEDEERKNEEKRKKKKEENSEEENLEVEKERKTKTKKRRNKRKNHSNRDDRENNNNNNNEKLSPLDSVEGKKRKKKENIDEEMKRPVYEVNESKKKRKNKIGKRRKEEDGTESKKGEEGEMMKTKKKKLKNKRNNKETVNQITEKINNMETKKEGSEIDLDSVLEIKKNLEDVLNKLNKKLDKSRKFSQRRRRRRKKRKKIKVISNKMSDKQNVDEVALADKETIDDKKMSKKLNEKEDRNENKERKEKRKKKARNEVEDLKDVQEEEKENETKRKKKKKKTRNEVEDPKEDLEEGEEEEERNENEEKRKKKKNRVKNEVEDPKEDLEEEERRKKKKKRVKNEVEDPKEDLEEEERNENEERRKKKKKREKNEIEDAKEDLEEEEKNENEERKNKKRIKAKNKVEGSKESVGKEGRNGNEDRKEKKRKKSKNEMADSKEGLEEEERTKNEEKRKKKSRKAKNEVEEAKEGVKEEEVNETKKKRKKNRSERKQNEEITGNSKEGWKTNNTEKKSQKEDINEEETKKKKERVKNEPKKKKKDMNDKNEVNKDLEKYIKERGKKKKEKDERDMKKNLNEKEKNRRKKKNRQKDENEENDFENSENRVNKRKKKDEKDMNFEENNEKEDNRIKKKRKGMISEERKKATDEEEKEKDVEERKIDKIRNKKRKEGMDRNDASKEKEQKSKKETRKKKNRKKEGLYKDSEEYKKERKKLMENEEGENEVEREKKRKEDSKKSVQERSRKNMNEMEAKDKTIEGITMTNKRKKADNVKVDLVTEKKVRSKKSKKSDISATTSVSLVEEEKDTRNSSRNRKSRRKRKKILAEKLQNPPIFIQNEEQSLEEEMKNKSKQIENDVYESKRAVESIVKQLKEFSPDPCTRISNNINQLRLNVSQIRQKIQLARTIVSAMKIPVSLNGKQRLEVILDQKDESREIQTSVEICIKPKSQNSAILSLHANNSHSYSLALVDSKPLLTIWGASGDMLQKLEADTKLIQDNWYQLFIRRMGQNFSLSINPTGSKSKGTTVQKLIPDFSPEQIPLSLASLGGYPENFPISNSDKLNGCIAYLNVNGHSTHILFPLESGSYPSSCQTGCESTTNTSMVFEGNGFALLESKEIFKKAFTSVHLTFKTFQKNALLMAIKKNSKILFLMALIDGNLRVESKVKSVSNAKQSQGINFSDGKFHTIQVTVIKNQLEIKTSEKVDFEDQDSNNNEMFFEEGISLGGLVSNLRNESKYRSFTGCLSNVSIDDKMLSLLYLKDGRHVYQGDCQENTWMSCARFTNSSAPVTLTKYDHVRSISLMISVKSQGVALYIERDSKFSISFQFTESSLKISNYEDDEIKTIPKKNSSGFWHLLHMEDQKGNIHISLDGEESIDLAYTEDTSGWFSASNADDFSMVVTVGGLPKDHGSFKKLDVFIGSISTLFIEHFRLNLNQEFANTNNLLVCAKPTIEVFTNTFNCSQSIGG